MIDWNPIAEKFREADAILIGASNGLSITEGLHLFADNAAFDELFGDKLQFIYEHADKLCDDLVEVGNHKMLMEKKGFYYDLVSAQIH